MKHKSCLNVECLSQSQTWKHISFITFFVGLSLEGFIFHLVCAFETNQRQFSDPFSLIVCQCS